MNKKYFIFFIGFTIPVCLTAQQNVFDKIQNHAPATTVKSSPKVKTAIRSPLTRPMRKAVVTGTAGGGRNIPHRLTIATTYGNEWINYTQHYYKIPIVKDGIYRIYPNTLSNAGIPISSIDEGNYQVFFRGQEQYIYVQCKNTFLNAANGDYIEFYGQHNDGTLDSTLYYNTKFLPNPYYSLSNDTSSYYLTWNSSTSNNRMAKQTDTSFATYGAAAPYVITYAITAGGAYPTSASHNLSSTLTLIQSPYYSQGAWIVDGTYTPNDPRFTQNSAWPMGWISYNTSGIYYPNVSQVYTGAGAPNAFMRTVVLGVDTGSCTFNISASGAGTLLNNFPLLGFAALDTTFTFPASDVAINGFNVNYYNNAIRNTNIVAPTYIYLNYPHTPILTGDSTFVMLVPDNGSAAKTYLDFTNLSTTGSFDSVRMYDLTNHNRFWVKSEGGGFKVVVPNSGGLKQCYLTSDAVIATVTTLIPVGINRNGVFTNFTANMPGNAYMIVTNPLLWNAVQAYAQHRQSKYQTVMADVYELYDQFGYGDDYSPLGIRRFCNYAIDKWPSPPVDLFLIGKGIHSYNYRADTTLATHSEALVPSYGYPSSDILFTNGLGGDSLIEPAIPTGRLAALSNADVATYLAKVETYEGAAPAQWMKNVAHFAGGSGSTEQVLANYLAGFAASIEGPLFGGNVYLFQKTSSINISTNLSDSIKNLIDNGVSIMTFFGHADGSNWDESIDYPSDYTNYNKYPFIMALACFSGDIYQPIGQAVSTVSEQFVLTNPGSIAFLASDYLGNPTKLAPYGQKIYDDLGTNPFYRHSIGRIIQNSIAYNQADRSQLMTNTCLEMCLHGDPAIAINAKDSLPDYAVNDQSIFFTPANVSILQDSFKVNVVVANYGEALNQSVNGILTRTLPGGTSNQYPFAFTHIYYQDTVSITLPVNQSLGLGPNYFSVSVNLTPTVDTELTLSNNSIGNPGVLLYIGSEDVTPVWPYDYAIIPKDTATLKASTDDPFAAQRTYIFEIDTSHSFNSPLFRSDTVTKSGGVIMASPRDEWNTKHFKGPLKGRGSNNLNRMPLQAVTKSSENISVTKNAVGVESKTMQNNFTNNKYTAKEQPSISTAKQPIAQTQQNTQVKDIAGQKNNIALTKLYTNHVAYRDSFLNNTVYYWRVRRDTSDSGVISSFQYIKNKNGWGQSHFFQYYNDELYNDDYNFINYNTTPRNWTFNTVGHTLECNTFGMIPPPYNSTDLYGTEYKIDNFVQAEAGCQYAWGIYVAVINPTTMVPWSTANYNFGNANCPTCSYGCTNPDSKFIFWDAISSQTLGLIGMLNAVPNGYYILAYTWVQGVFKASSGLTNDSLVVAAFQNLGAAQMSLHRTTPGMDSVPWIFFVQKGNPAGAHELYGHTATDSLQLSVVMNSNGSYGAITTPLIGPSSKYDSLSWFQHSADQPPLTDSTRLNILGVEASGDVKPLISDITPTVANLYISSINPVTYPYIQLQLYTKDATNHTPSQMNYWRVFYQPVPEVAMNPNIYTYFHADTLAYGDVLKFQTTVQNISDWPIDSTQLLIWTTNQQNNVTYYNPKKLVKPLNPGDTAKISFSLNDANASANTLRSVWFEINPVSYPDTRLEQFHFNDFAEKSFYSYGDKINPVVDVTFNGIHILNNDIVSAQPNILMTFLDENKYLPMNNPADFQVYLRNTNTSDAQLIPYGPILSFTPATLPQNKASLLYTPTLADGTYELTVQGTDIAGNVSAINSYKIDFQVINKSMISEVLNYPDPFSTSTRFVFILTGEKIPTIFKIQIMTVTGKIVREINEAEIGSIHIGTNITQYAWDGTDQYGNRLANGVYLYHVVTSINGQGIDNYQTEADQYFTKGWGKMYLMR